MVAIAKEVWRHNKARLERELEPQLKAAISEICALNTAVYTAFRQTSRWLDERSRLDNPLIVAHRALSAARRQDERFLYSYYIPYDTSPNGVVGGWSSYWKAYEGLMENVVYYPDTVRYAAENMAVLDTMERDVELARKEGIEC